MHKFSLLTASRRDEKGLQQQAMALIGALECAAQLSIYCVVDKLASHASNQPVLRETISALLSKYPEFLTQVFHEKL